MKPLFKVLIFTFVFSSCKHDKILFSCDPNLNQYVSTHRSVLKSLSLTDINNSDLEFQQAVFRNYDATKKRDIWIQKIQSLLENQAYSHEEFAHVNSLLEHLCENYFVKEYIANERVDRKQFANDWIYKAKNTLGWSDKQIAFVVYRLYTTADQFNVELQFQQSINQEDSTDPVGNCRCNSSTDYCVSNYFLILPFLQPPELFSKIDDYDDVVVAKVFITGNNSERSGELFWL